ncbi:hypothetical protein RV04_GL001921 [Enterococcus hermanniensis]|uniref:VWFA domain-containing protein n=2 Tax=Enterococcus hermanniensis TaxID=249189 RepID=A0A1L8TNC1_9ENTE|nr:hypothetical protein RV04_GL001921 [Enterococcus hermanniensis]
MLLNSFLGLKSVLANDFSIIFNNEQLVLKKKVTSTANDTNWQIEYQKTEGKIAFQFIDDTGQIILPQNSTNFESTQDKWMMEKTIKNTGVFNFTTTSSTKEIKLYAKIYQTNSDKESIIFQITDPLLIKSDITEQANSITDTTKKIQQSSTSSANTTTSSSVEDTTISSEQPKAALKATAAAQVLAIPLSGTVSNSDPFAYTQNSTGNFLTNSTNSYTNNLTSEYIKNYTFNRSLTEGTSTVKNIFSSGSLTFENGYHDYDDVLLKKTISPTSDPTQFNIQLDMIGKALVNRQKVDVIFVIDKSSSMNDRLGSSGSRWDTAQTALKNFADNLLNSSNNDTIRMALASFGSVEKVPFADIAKFNNSFFINNSTTYKDHPLLNQKPGIDSSTGSGTPTYLGLDAAYALATNTQFGSRTDAAKVVIMLTDGEPTYTTNDTYSSLTNRILDLPTTSSTTKNRYSAQRTNGTSTINYFSGNGSNDQSDSTISYVNQRNNSSLFQNIKKYSIGYITGTNNVLKTIGTDGTYTANNENQLTTILNSLSTALTATIQNATLSDPLSAFVDLINTPTIQALSLVANSLNLIAENSLNYPAYADQVQKNFSPSQLQLSNINLGSDNATRQGLRLNYKVQLKEAYRDNLFYPTNGMTVLTNQLNNAATYYHFAIPSARVPKKTIDLQVKKTWDDSQNKWGLRKAITFQLQQKIGTTWTNVSGQSKTLPATTTNWSTSFSNLQQYQNGIAIDYRVIETSESNEFISGYEKPVYSPTSTTAGATLEVINTLKTTFITLKKFQPDGETPLANAKFGLYLKNKPQTMLQEATSTTEGNVVLSDLPIGSYLLKEITAPNGYSLMNDLNFVISQNTQGELVIDGLPTENKLINQLKDFKFSFTKTSTTGTALSGATFELSQNGTVLETSTSTKDGTVSFSKELRPGQYNLKETQAPAGYSTPTNQWTLTIDQKQNVTIKNQTQEIIYNQKALFDTEKNSWIIKDFKLTNQLNDFTLKVLKKDSFGNSLNGAVFKLTGPNQYSKIITGEQATFEFIGLNPGTYSLSEIKTPEGYQSLKDSVTIFIDTSGKVVIDQKELPSVLSKNGNIIQLEITNQVLMPLPKTGGIGLLPFILIGFITAATFGTALFIRRVGDHNEN